MTHIITTHSFDVVATTTFTLDGAWVNVEFKNNVEVHRTCRMRSPKGDWDFVDWCEDVHSDPARWNRLNWEDRS